MVDRVEGFFFAAERCRSLHRTRFVEGTEFRTDHVDANMVCDLMKLDKEQVSNKIGINDGTASMRAHYAVHIETCIG
jgi:hypothetical protein